VHPGQVVSETVAEVKRKEGEAPGKFANAVLRKVADTGRQWREMPPAANPSAEDGARWASFPEWLWKRLVAERGLAWTQAFAQACLERPRIWIRARAAEAYAGWSTPGPVAGSLEITGSAPAGAVTAWPGFAAGDFFVQDVSSQTLVEEIAREVRKGAGERPTALDLCAAPGGKSAGLEWSGFAVTATDLNPARLALLEQTVARAARTVQVVKREQVATLPAFDLVWVDAPCTGTGIIRRHPDVRWLRRESDLEALNRTQDALIAEAWGKVRPGGYLAYSVCSVLRGEGEERIAHAGLAGAERVAGWDLAPQTAPYGDGFWAVLLRKPS
jgi:16S rRNA (cytosine967-C5)-methyltransferase